MTGCLPACGSMRCGDILYVYAKDEETAARDIEELIALGVLQKDAAGGRSTSYSLLSIDR